jgi:hypothetical protein
MGFKIPRFHKGLMLPGLSRLTDKGERVTHTSSIVTELPTSVTYKIFSNALIGSQVIFFVTYWNEKIHFFFFFKG